MNLNKLLLEASKSGSIQLVKQLVESGANSRTFHLAAFKLAVRGGHLEIVKYFIEIGVNIRNIGYPIVYIAASSGRRDVANFLSEELKAIDRRLMSPQGRLQVRLYKQQRI